MPKGEGCCGAGAVIADSQLCSLSTSEEADTLRVATLVTVADLVATVLIHSIGSGSAAALASALPIMLPKGAPPASGSGRCANALPASSASRVVG